MSVEEFIAKALSAKGIYYDYDQTGCFYIVSEDSLVQMKLDYMDDKYRIGYYRIDCEIGVSDLPFEFIEVRHLETAIIMVLAETKIRHEVVGL